MERLLLTAGGKIQCLRCNAMSKRTKLQCGGPAMRGKTKVSGLLTASLALPTQM